MPKYKFFESTEGAAYKDKSNDIEWDKAMVQYPKKDGEYIDIKILIDPKNSEWNKSVCSHKFLRTKISYGKPHKIKDEDGNWVKNKDIKWLGSKRCLPAKNDHTPVCENCKFLVSELKKIEKIIEKVYKVDASEMKMSEFSDYVKELDEKAKEDDGLKKLRGINLKYTQLKSSLASWDKYFSTDVYGQGIRLLEAKPALKKYIDKLWKEEKDPTHYWIRIENNSKNAKSPGGSLNDYYLVYESPLNKKEGFSEPTESQLQMLNESSILNIYKKLLELEDPEVQLKHLDGIFENRKEDKEDLNFKEEGSVSASDVASVEDLEDINSVVDDAVNESLNQSDNTSEDEGEEELEEDLDIGSLLGDDLLEDNPVEEKASSKKNSESIPIRPKKDEEEDQDGLFSSDLDDDLKDIADLVDEL